MAAQAEASLFETTLTPEQTQALRQFAAPLSSSQLVWASGFLSGLAAQTGPELALFETPIFGSPTSAVEATPVAAPVAQNQPQTTILYGSESGNGQTIATTLANALGQSNVEHKLVSMADYNPKSLKKESRLVVVVSTHGEGDPPEDAEDFYEFLMSNRAPKLNSLSYAVLALGDSSYAYFCETGRRIDQRLSELGATAIMSRVDCDVDFKPAAESWSKSLLDRLQQEAEEKTSVVSLRPAEPVTTQYTRENPLLVTRLTNQRITGRASGKAVHHIELDIEDTGLSFEPGDSLGVVPKNSPRLVAEFLKLTGLSHDASVQLSEKTLSVTTALTDYLELSNLSSGFLTEYAQHTQATELLDACEDPVQRAELFATHQIIDVIRRFPTKLTAQQWVDLLPRIAPRLYSIASSQEANPDEVHLTVDILSYNAFGAQHHGVASTHLTQETDEEDTFAVYVDQNPKFRLPANPEAPIIMIGPGTGVAPFRAFLQQREHANASGKNWLFFGAQHFESDFLYQMEWLRYRKQGLLTKLSTAFSRDQKDKIYVQHRLLEEAEAMFEWLESGAYVYVCGDAKHMAPDVHQALLQIVMERGHKTEDEANAYLKQLRREGRYQKDVY